MALVIIQPPAGEITNPLSRFEVTVDGQFSPVLEWSDVTPRAFQSGTPPVPVPLGTPSSLTPGDTLVYGALAPGFVQTELYLMYEYRGRTNPNFSDGETIGEIGFPVRLNGLNGAPSDLKVIIKSRGAHDFTGAHNMESSFFDVFFEVNNGPGPSCTPVGVGTAAVSPLCNIEAGVGFNASPFGALHLMIELEVPLLTPPNFFNPNTGLPQGPLNGVYSPAPAFWGAEAPNNLIDPPISAALFRINPDGSTAVCPVPGPCSFAVDAPLPGSLWLLSLGLAGLGLSRRKQA